jgi:hypothetical protein
MKNRCSVLAVAVVLSGVVLLGVAYAAAQDHQHMQMAQQPTAQHGHQDMQMGQQLKIGKTGQVSFSQPTKVGEVLLPAGSYRFVHRVAGDDHFVQFTQTSPGSRDFGEVKCQIEPRSKKVSQTAITTMDEGGVRRITRIEVAGENVTHVFQLEVGSRSA